MYRYFQRQALHALEIGSLLFFPLGAHFTCPHLQEHVNNCDPQTQYEREGVGGGQTRQPAGVKTGSSWPSFHHHLSLTAKGCPMT